MSESREEYLAGVEHSKFAENLRGMPLAEIMQEVDYSHADSQDLKDTLIEFILDHHYDFTELQNRLKGN